MITKNTTPLENRTDLNETEQKLWRTLVRVDSINKGAGTIQVVLSGWNPREKVQCSLENMPDDLRTNCMNKGYRFHAQANIGVENKEDLYLCPPYELS
jgi:hypothetical protein